VRIRRAERRISLDRQFTAVEKSLAEEAKRETGHDSYGESAFVNLFTNWRCNHGHRQAAYPVKLNVPAC
jgi:hypothetical protein